MSHEDREDREATAQADHIDLETLGVLAEGTASASLAERSARHLAACRTCMAAYADAVRYRSAWISIPGALTPTSAMRRLAEDAIARSERARDYSRGLRRAAAAAVAVVVISAGARALLWREHKLPPSGVYPNSTALRQALERESADGLVLPGGEGAAGRNVPIQRSGAATVEHSLDSAVARAFDRYQDGDRSDSSAFWVAAGYLALGNLDAARGYVTEGLREHPKDRNLSILAAAVDYRNSDLDQAESRLRDLHRKAPDDDLVQLDLAIVLQEQGAVAEARSLLDSLIALRPGTPLAERAARIRAAPPR